MSLRMSVIAALITLVGFVSSGQAEATAEVGKPAPDFRLKDAVGSEKSLADYKGKIVVLEWINPECPFVVRHYEAKTMQNLARQYAGQEVVWLAINSTSTTTPEQNKAWIEKYGLTYPILLDQDGKVGKLYGAKTTPHMYIINKDGVLAYKGGIDDDPMGSKTDRSNHVAAALDELTAGKPVAHAETKSYGCSVKYAK